VFAAVIGLPRYDPAMSKLLLNLRNVPDDEADDVRALLDTHGIAYYETRPGPWNISVGGIWIKDDAAIIEAKRLMVDYQDERGRSARAEHAAAVRDGTVETFWMQLRAEPARVLLTLLAITFLLGLVALPVVLLRG
jgi:hypothetical protein